MGATYPPNKYPMEKVTVVAQQKPMTAAVTPGREELLGLAHSLDLCANGHMGLASDIKAVRDAAALIRRLATKPSDEGVLTALVDARPYLASAVKRSQHAYDKAALEQVDDAIRALSTTGNPKP